MSRRREGGIVEVMSGAFKNAEGAVGAVILGFFAWGPVPEIIVRTLFGEPQSIQGANAAEIGGVVMSNAFSIAGLTIMPLIEVIGAALMFAGFAGFAWHAHKGYFKSERFSRGTIAGFFLVITIGFAWLTIMSFQTASSYDEMQKHMKAVAGATETHQSVGPVNDSAPMQNTEPYEQARQAEYDAYQASGARFIYITDQTGTPEFKIIRLRTAETGRLIATVIVEPGEQKYIPTDISFPLRVTAITMQTFPTSWDDLQTSTVTVDLGYIIPDEKQPGVIAMGAEGQPMRVIDNSAF